MVKITTKTGFECSIDTDALANDWELLELLSDIDGGNVAAMVKILPFILPDKNDQKRIKDHCRENGKVKLDKMTAEIMDIFQGAKEGKNSLSSPES